MSLTTLKHALNDDRPIVTDFLSESEISLVKERLRQTNIRFEGGHSRAKRKRVATFNHPITIIPIKIIPKTPTKFTHPDILGTLLSQNIPRNQIGDILPKNNLFFITKAVRSSALIISRIKNTEVQLKVEQTPIIEYYDEFLYFEKVVSSLRLDVIVKTLAETAREKAKTLILNDYVKVNDSYSHDFAQTINLDDTISIRQVGKFFIESTPHQTKKGNTVLKYKKFI
ncbi:MAG: hypothetical protein K9L74_00090 [Candidatus Izimaplasma sp.]|nr:hypothetical protein [Candidatus Izimaplasma bacterium]